MYEGKYLLGTSFARPVIAKRLVEIAKKEKADAICHGCTGKGNDQVRFELSIKALAPDMKIIAPWRIWDIKSRDEEIDYAVAHGLDVPVTKAHNYSMDRNLWHLSHEGSDLEDPANAPKDEMLLISKPVKDTPDAPEYVSIDWVKGVPVAVNGKKLAPVALIETLNEIGARHGVGVDDMVENRLVGMKSRGVYENPQALYFTPRTKTSKKLRSTATPRILKNTSRSNSPTLFTTASGTPRSAKRCPRSWTARRSMSRAMSNSNCLRARLRPRA